ncbi:MAG: leucine--tRNA ligase, partial [Thermoanaerobaculia bacterium]
WCPALGTVLANEEVKDGRYVETGDPVERRLMRQWMLKITAYAERLLADLDLVDWPEHVKEMQRNWIGRSQGAEIDFQVAGGGQRFTVFTTRPDTLFGCTFCVLAPEHPLVREITAPERRPAVEAYVAGAAARSEAERADTAEEKHGVFTGAFAVHPVTGAPLQIWVGDYVLMGYGTGAIMGVPGQDQRDWDFAERNSLPIVRTVEPPANFDGQAFLGEGPAIHSQFLDGLTIEPAKDRMIRWLEEHAKGRRRVEYKLRDWLFSRQRYWGEPFPIVHLPDGEICPLPESVLPVELPSIDEYRPTDDGRPPLARAPQTWLSVTLPDGRVGQRETNTMPQWAGSCWYYLRYLDPRNDREIFSREAERYWMPVDLYIGGVEHAVLHLLYARFWHKVLFDCGLVSTPEPFQRLFNQGMILAYSYQDARGKYYDSRQVVERAGRFFAGDVELTAQVEKMSKSKSNVFSPDEIIDQHGADAMRLYELFMGPLEAQKPWQMAGVEGVRRFLERVWRLVVEERSGELSARVTEAPAQSEPELHRLLHKTIQKVLADTEALAMNTAISQMMIFVNAATQAATLPREILETFLRVLAPYAPHLAEESWSRLGHQE